MNKKDKNFSTKINSDLHKALKIYSINNNEDIMDIVERAIKKEIRYKETK